MRTLHLLLALVVSGASLPSLSASQDGPYRTEAVTYQNPEDGTLLSATITLPAGEGPFPGVVLLSLAGADDLVEELRRRGSVVLRPERRGMRTIEHLLRATFQHLANDVQAAASYLRSRAEVDPELVGVIGQGAETTAVVMAAAAEPVPAFLVLLSATGLPGPETFRIEQLSLAAQRGANRAALDDLDAYLEEFVDIVLSDTSAGFREVLLRGLIAESDVQLPRGAAFPPNPQDQVRFFASPWWRDQLSFQPDQVLARLRSPVLVLMGVEDPMHPYEEHLRAIRSSLEEAPTEDATVCLLPGRTRHSFPPEVVGVIGEWLGDRIPLAEVPEADPGVRPMDACLGERELRSPLADRDADRRR